MHKLIRMLTVAAVAVGTLTVGAIAASAPAQACEPTHTGTLPSGTEVYFGCQVEISSPPPYQFQSTIGISKAVFRLG